MLARSSDRFLRHGNRPVYDLVGHAKFKVAAEFAHQGPVSESMKFCVVLLENLCHSWWENRTWQACGAWLRRRVMEGFGVNADGPHRGVSQNRSPSPPRRIRAASWSGTTSESRVIQGQSGQSTCTTRQLYDQVDCFQSADTALVLATPRRLLRSRCGCYPSRTSVMVPLRTNEMAIEWQCHFAVRRNRNERH